MKWCEIFLQASIIIAIFLPFFPFIFSEWRINFLLSALESVILLLAIIFRGIHTCRFPVINLYESLIFLAWGVSLVPLLSRRRWYRVIISSTGIAILLLTGAATLLPPWEKAPHYLIPALQSYWLYIHVVTSFLSYSGFFIAFFIAVVYFMSKNKEKKKSLDNLAHSMILVSFPLLTLGIVTGSIWAHFAWGRYWSWDPKETWSLVTWLIYAGYLHARITRGWHGRRSALFLIAGFLAVIFTFIGVNYLLPGLHSYL